MNAKANQDIQLDIDVPENGSKADSLSDQKMMNNAPADLKEYGNVKENNSDEEQ